MQKLTLNEVKNFITKNNFNKEKDFNEEYLNILANIKSGKFILSPKQAKYLLSHCNKANRRINKSHVETLKRDMESGHWYNDIDYIGFDKNGTLINGQHRLKALSLCDPNLLIKNMNIVDGSYKLETMTDKQKLDISSIELKFDFDVEQHISMDTGNVRKYSDQITISKKLGHDAGLLPNKFKIIITAGLRLNDPKINLSNTELAYIWDEYKDRIMECESRDLFNVGSKAGSTVKSSILWAYLSGVDIETLSNFSTVLRTGITRKETDIPIIRLRDHLVDLRGNGRNLDVLRAKYTQQCIFNVLQGATTNRLPSNPIMHYQDYPLLKNIKK